MENKLSDALAHKGHGYVTLTEGREFTEMSNILAELMVKKITGEEYTLLTVNNNTDSRKATPDPRVYTFLLTSTFVKQQAKRLKNKHVK